MPDLALRINGLDYSGWTAARITRGIETIAGSFALEVSDRWSEDAEPWPIAEEDPCTVLIDNAPVLTGFVDRRTIGVNAQSHGFSVEGRDKAAALVDCSAVLKRWEFANIGILELCQQVAAPFGISVTLQDGIDDGAISTKAAASSSKPKGGGSPNGVGSAGKSSSLKIGTPNEVSHPNPGDSAFEIMDHYCRTVGVLPVSDGNGGVVLTRAGGAQCATALVEGVNILDGSIVVNASGRYRTYVIYGQSRGTDDSFAEAVAHVVGQPTTDLGVRRAERVLIVQPEGNVTTKFASARGQWEATVRAARAVQASITVQGWTQDDGTLWPYGAIVSVKSRRLGLDGPLLITEVVFSLSIEAGSTTTLKLTRPDAFLPEPILKSDGGIRHIAGLDDVH